ncbi:MAG: T9SS type A sorting domain-containing protein [bacterium]|nr:T9SS type A sorting domain-containing protein [bacterium]
MNRGCKACLALMTVTLAFSSALATDRLVPVPYATIQAAIDDAEDGDVIMVGPGQYYETASNRGVFAETGPYQFGLYINKEVTIVGVDDDGDPITNAEDVAAVITTNSTANFGPSGIFVQANSVTLQGLEIGDNIVNNVVSSNKTIEVVGDAFTMTACKINTSADQGAFYMGEWDAAHDIIQSYQITNNVFHNALVSINNGAGDTGLRSGRIVTGNVFTGTIYPYAMCFRGWNGANPAQGWILHPVGGAIITGNTFANATDHYFWARGNTGGYLNDEFDWEEIWTSNTFAHGAVTLSGTFNPRTFSDAGGYPESRDIAPRIQAAIDIAASGDVVRIGAGTYEEQLHITTDNLIIRGAGATSTTVLSPVDLALGYTTSAANYPIVFIDGCDGTLIEGLTVDGDGRGNSNYRFQGVAFWNASGGLTDVHVVDVMDTPFSGAQHGVGVYAYNNTAGPYEVTLTDVNVSGYQKGGIVLNGNGNLTANVVDCEAIGAGATNVTAQNGIQFWGTTSGTIDGCNVADNMYTGTGWAAACILMISAGDINIMDSQLTNGMPAVYCQDTNADATGLTIINSDINSGNGFYASVLSGMSLLNDGGMHSEAAPSPFGESNVAGSAARGVLSVTLDACDFGGQGTGYGLSASSSIAMDQIDITAGACSIHDWGWGVVAYGSGGEIATHLNDNSFAGNDGWYYAAPALTSVQDAQYNWWGSVDPDDFAAAVIGDIDFSPWLGSGTDTEPGTPGFQGDFSTLWVGPGSSIQDAINMVSGSTVYVLPGTYPGSLTLPANLNLVATGGAALTTISGTTDVVLNVQGDNVTVDGFTVTNPNGHYGLTAQDKNLLAVRNCHFNDIGTGTTSAYAYGMTIVSNASAINGITVEDNEISMVHGHANGGGGGIAVGWTNATYDATNVVIQQNHIHNIRSADNLKGAYGIIMNMGGSSNPIYTGRLVNPQILNNTIHDLEGLWAHGIGLEGNTPGAIVTGNAIYDLVDHKAEHDAVAIMVESNDDADDLNIHNNQFYDTYWGVVNISGPVMVNASDNWWGSPSGPYHPTLNVDGTGVRVTDYVTFEPWMTNTGDPVVTIYQALDNSLISVNDNGAPYPATTTLRLSTGASSTAWRGVSIEVVFDPSVLTLQSYTVLLTEAGTFGQVISPSAGHLLADFSILGGTRYAAADLFDLVFNATSQPEAPFTTSFHLRETTLVRDFNNQPLEFTLDTDEILTIDGTVPSTFTQDPTLSASYVTADPTWTLHGVDSHLLGHVEHRVDSGIWTLQGPASVDDDDYTWSVDAFGLADGYHTVDFRLFDKAGNQHPTVLANTFYLDTTVPTIFEITDGPAHNACLAESPSWTLHAEDDVMLGTILAQVDGGGYSTVVTVTPDSPTWSGVVGPFVLADGMHTVEFQLYDKAGFVHPSTLTSTFILDTALPQPATALDLDPGHGTVRLDWAVASGHDGYKIYRALRPGYPYLGAGVTTPKVYGVDPFMLIATITDPSATGYDDIYWGGDYAVSRGIYDYAVVAYDCAHGEAAAVSGAATNYFLGDWAKQATPIIPDDYDGKVFSADMTELAGSYGTTSGHPAFDPEHNVAPTSGYSNYGLPQPDSRINFEDLMIFSMNYGEGGPQLDFDSRIAGGPAELVLRTASSGHELTLSGSVKGFSAQITCPGTLLSATASFPVFFYRDGGEWVVDAVSLNGQIPAGSQIHLSFGEGSNPELVSAEGRNSHNQTVALSVVNGEALPTAYALSQNFPNPFNPTTTIRYALPEAADVRLVLFNALGQEVMVLASGSREAGFHEARLDGSGLASGVYVYRLEAGRFMDQKKLVLVK